MAPLGRQCAAFFRVEVRSVNSVVSVNVGLPRDVAWQGKVVHTGIWKKSVTGRVMARRLNLNGDGQGKETADLTTTLPRISCFSYLPKTKDPGRSSLGGRPGVSREANETSAQTP